MLVVTLFYSFFCYVLGLSLLRPFFERSDSILSHSMSLAFGVGVSVVLALLFAVIGVPYTQKIIIGGVLVVALISAVISMWRAPVTKTDLIYFVGFVALIVGVESLFFYYNISSFSPDSFGFIRHGLNLVEHQSIWSLFGDSALFYKVLHSFAVLLELPYFSSLALAIGVCMCIACAAFCYRILEQYHLSRSLSLVLVMLLMALFVSATKTQAHFFYINNHMFAASYVAFAIILFCTGVLREKVALNYLAALMLILFSLTRVEANLYGVLLLLIFLSEQPNSIRVRSSIIYGVGAMFVPLLTVLKGSPGMFGAVPMLLLGVGGLLCAMLYYFCRYSFVQLFIKNIVLAVFSFLLLFSVWAFFDKWEHMLESVSNFISNLFVTGLWGSFWWVAFVSMALYFVPSVKMGKMGRRFIVTVTACIFVTILISYFRLPYRLGWTDSGNRIVFHYAPIIIFYWAFLFGAAYKKVQSCVK